MLLDPAFGFAMVVFLFEIGFLMSTIPMSYAENLRGVLKSYSFFVRHVGYFQQCGM